MAGYHCFSKLTRIFKEKHERIAVETGCGARCHA